jgi:hypothetical protein
MSISAPNPVADDVTVAVAVVVGATAPGCTDPDPAPILAPAPKPELAVIPPFDPVPALNDVVLEEGFIIRGKGGGIECPSC